MAKEHPQIRVLHLVSGDLWAGAEVMAYHLLRHLKGCPGLAVQAIVLNHGRLAELLKSERIPLQIFDEKALSFWEILCGIRRTLLSFVPHVVHSHRYKENALALLSSAGSGSRLISTQHGLPEVGTSEMPTAQRGKHWLNFRVLSHHFSRTVAVSAEMKSLLVDRYGFDPELVCVIPNGIGIPEAVPVPDRMGACVIGTAARLVPVKDLPLMVQVAQRLEARGGGFRFEVVGEGPERPRLERFIEEGGLSGKFFLKGHQQDLVPFYRNLDLYLNTSLHEGIPMGVLEALSMGLPVVAPAVGGLREVIEDGVEGFLIPERDADAFAEKCRLLRDDRLLRRKMALAARKKAETAFSAEVMANRYRQLYLSIAG